MTTYHKCTNEHIFSVRTFIRKNADRLYCPFCGSSVNHRITKHEYDLERGD